MAPEETNNRHQCLSDQLTKEKGRPNRETAHGRNEKKPLIPTEPHFDFDRLCQTLPSNFLPRISRVFPTNDFAKVGLALETTIVLSLMKLSGTIGHADRLDPNMFHDRNHLSHFCWLTQ